VNLRAGVSDGRELAADGAEIVVGIFGEKLLDVGPGLVSEPAGDGDAGSEELEGGLDVIRVFPAGGIISQRLVEVLLGKYRFIGQVDRAGLDGRPFIGDEGDGLGFHLGQAAHGAGMLLAEVRV
jgi:hypothetical protein